MKLVTADQIRQMDYVSFMGLLNETNRPPGGKDTIRKIAQNAFLARESHILHAGCNTGYCSFELSHLVKCRVTAIDINEKMLSSARQRLAEEPLPYQELISFVRGDAHNLCFGDDTFDLVVSGGSTAFMRDREMVLREYVRVCKPFGFIGDAFLHYREQPPLELTRRVSEALGVNVTIWKRDDWISLYTTSGLELYYTHDGSMVPTPDDAEIRAYCNSIVRQMAFEQPGAHEAALSKLIGYMSLFSENHGYLAYTVLLCRKTAREEQISLFGR
jgi:SAM-dependent methyltransferase